MCVCEREKEMTEKADREEKKRIYDKGWDCL